MNDQGPSRNIDITIVSDSGNVSVEWVRDDLIPGLNDAIVYILPNSRATSSAWLSASRTT